MTQELELRVAQCFMLVNSKMSRTTAELAIFKNDVVNAIQPLATKQSIRKEKSPRSNVCEWSEKCCQKTEKAQAQGGYPSLVSSMAITLDDLNFVQEGATLASNARISNFLSEARASASTPNQAKLHWQTSSGHPR